MPDYFFKRGSRSPLIFKLKEFFNLRTYLASKNNRANVFDAGFQASVAEYQQYHKLKVQDGFLNQETYAEIGKELDSFHLEMMAFKQPLLKRLLYGVGLTDVCSDWAEILPIISAQDFIGWNYNYPKVPRNCLNYAREQLKKVGRDLKSTDWGTPTKLNRYIYRLLPDEDITKMKEGYQAQQFAEGVLYLKKAIKSKIPVVVGVDDEPDIDPYPKTPKLDYSDKNHITDHYVTIVGMGADANGKFFLFYDNALNPEVDNQREIATSPDNRLYCDCANFTIKGEGDSRNKYIQTREYKSLTVRQIRESR